MEAPPFPLSSRGSAAEGSAVLRIFLGNVFRKTAARAEGIGRVPHVRLSVRGPKKMGDPDFLPRGATNVRVCGFH
jgi:hypothetical protein